MHDEIIVKECVLYDKELLYIMYDDIEMNANTATWETVISKPKWVEIRR